VPFFFLFARVRNIAEGSNGYILFYYHIHIYLWSNFPKFKIKLKFMACISRVA
jgi:hypothetical protein